MKTDTAHLDALPSSRVENAAVIDYLKHRQYEVMAQMDHVTTASGEVAIGAALAELQHDIDRLTH